MIAMELFPEAIEIPVPGSDRNAFALAWLRFLAGVGFEVRI